MSQINDILKLINDSNNLTCTLPDSNEKITFKRYSIDSLNTINKIFDKKTNNEVIFDYYKYLIDLCKKCTTDNVSYIDYNYILLFLRSKENSSYNDLDIPELLNNISENIADVVLPDTAKVVDGPIEYQIHFEYPSIEKITNIIKKCKTTTTDILFYSLFKYIEKIDIVIDKKSSTAETIEDLRKLYNVISYKALDSINSEINKITDKFFSLYKINVEADTDFFLTL